MPVTPTTPHVHWRGCYATLCNGAPNLAGTIATARARAMRALGLPHPWADNVRQTAWLAYWREIDRLATGWGDDEPSPRKPSLMRSR